MPIERKLAAIMFTDIAGYTEQMSQDEDKAFSLIRKKRELLLPLIEQYEGKLIKEMGDGTLTRYFKADNAIDCASIFQSKTDTDLNVRIGIHTGEVIVNKEDVFGDVVNVASRLESIAVPGSVLVSKETIDKLEMSDKVELVSLGMQSLKGVGRLIEVYAIKDDSLVVPNPEDYTENKIEVHSDDEVPSIAIIPLKNKGDDKDIFYTYGISADLITDCSGAGLIRVASLKDIENLDYKTLDTSELASKLFVRYIAHGSLWKINDMFQLSIELYDTKDKKVVWSDRWQEKWNNLPTIKMNLSDGLLKALDTTSKVERKVETTNTEAYEYYLKAKYNYFKRSKEEDIELAIGLINKAISIDNKLIQAKNLLGVVHMEMGNYDKADKIFLKNIEAAKKINDKKLLGKLFSNLGWVCYDKGNYQQALKNWNYSLVICNDINDKSGLATCLHSIGLLYININNLEEAILYQNRSLKLCKELGDKRGIGYVLNSIGTIFQKKGDYEQALELRLQTLDIQAEISDKLGTSATFHNIGIIYFVKGDYNNAMDYYTFSYEICQELHINRGLCFCLTSIGINLYYKCDFVNSKEYLEKSLQLQIKLGLKDNDLQLKTTTYLYLTYKNLGKDYDVNEIHSLINDAENIEFELNYPLYNLLDDKSHLETAYNQVQEKASAMDEDLGKKFFSYPFPKAIVEEYNTVFKK